MPIDRRTIHQLFVPAAALLVAGLAPGVASAQHRAGQDGHRRPRPSATVEALVQFGALDTSTATAVVAAVRASIDDRLDLVRDSTLRRFVVAAADHRGEDPNAEIIAILSENRSGDDGVMHVLRLTLIDGSPDRAALDCVSFVFSGMPVQTCEALVAAARRTPITRRAPNGGDDLMRAMERDGVAHAQAAAAALGLTMAMLHLPQSSADPLSFLGASRSALYADCPRSRALTPIERLRAWHGGATEEMADCILARFQATTASTNVVVLTQVTGLRAPDAATLVEWSALRRANPSRSPGSPSAAASALPAPDRDGLRAVVTAARPAMQNCYEVYASQLPAHADLHADVGVRATIERDGSVDAVVLRGPRALTECLDPIVSAMRFGPSDEAQPVVFPLVFMPADASDAGVVAVPANPYRR